MTSGRPKKKVLLVDDEADVLALLSATLNASRDITVLMAHDGLEGLEVARRERPDVVFLDVQMPRMDGYSVCTAIKSDPALAGVRVIMLTAQAQESDRRAAAAARADDFLTKPFSPMALLKKLDEALGL